MTTRKKIVMSGMRPTGRLHLGNYWGALKNWISLQDQFQCFFMAADWHMFTTGYEDTGTLQENIREMVLDWLAAGLDPKKCVIFKQSSVPEHAELTLLLSMITPLSWLENNPTWKEQLQELAKTKAGKAQEIQTRAIVHAQESAEQQGELTSAGVPLSQGEDVDAGGKEWLRTYGFLGYPVLQAADILLYRGELVPVGVDQLPHVELSREIVRRFNSIYGRILTEPQPLLTPTPKVPGIDGRKMSKSYGNAVDIFETADSLNKKVMSMYTDATKIRANDPGHPLPCPENQSGCVVFALHRLYSDYADARETECKEGKIGCVNCKKDLLKSLNGPFEDFRKRRELFSSQKGLVEKILAEGSAEASKIAAQTMEKVRQAMRLK